MVSSRNQMTILDTNVVSEALRPNPDPAVATWIIGQVKASLFLTAVTEAELRYGIARMDAGRRRDELLRETESMLAFDFAGRILPFDSGTAQVYAAMLAERQNPIGRPIIRADLMIAAIARQHRAAVATRNTRDFADCGIPLINPWQTGGSI